MTGRAVVPEFTVLGAAHVEDAAAPTLRFELGVDETSGWEVFTIALTAQINVDPSRRSYDSETRTRLIEHDCDHDGTADDDPFVVLVEVQRPDRLSNEDNEDGSEHRVDRASPTAAQTSTANDRGGDHV